MSNQAPQGNPLSADSLAYYMITSLPRNASPQLKNAFDAIALAAHASLLSVGFRLIGLGEDHKIEADSDASQPKPIPEEWNAGNGSYSFRYAHNQSSMEYLLKINRMANKAIIIGMGMGDDKTCSFDITTRDYVSDGNLPLTPHPEGATASESTRKVMVVFISSGRLSDFGSAMRLNIIQKLVPSLQKAGYEETREAQPAGERLQQRDRPLRDYEPDRYDPNRYDPLREDRDQPARPRPFPYPLAQPQRPLPEPIPGFEDEYEALRPFGGGLGGMGMPRIGDRDLYPQGLGPRDPLYGGVGPGPSPFGGGGMHPTFDDPLFTGQGQRGQGYDPRAPPGSRYDPVGPGGGGHPRGAGMGGRPPNPFQGFGDGDFI